MISNIMLSNAHLLESFLLIATDLEVLIYYHVQVTLSHIGRHFRAGIHFHSWSLQFGYGLQQQNSCLDWYTYCVF